MTNFIFSDLFDQAVPAASPQLREQDGEATDATRPIHADPQLGHSAQRTAWSPSPLSLIGALAAQLEKSEARAQLAESQLAAHGRYCICRAANIAAEEAAILSAQAIGRRLMPTCDAVDAHEGDVSLAA